jgi:WXXGXW repeat (2 copies)
MRRTLMIALLGCTVAVGVVPAMAQGPYPPVPAVRVEPPPPPPPPGGVRYSWEPGHWSWNGATYAWVGGRYVPWQAHYVHYVPGHWATRGGTWVWVEAGWR